jgi:hypothetical protein
MLTQYLICCWNSQIGSLLPIQSWLCGWYEILTLCLLSYTANQNQIVLLIVASNFSFNPPKTKIKYSPEAPNRAIYDPTDFFGFKCQSKTRVTKIRSDCGPIITIYCQTLKKKYAKHLIKTRKLYQLQSRHIIMELSLFVVSTIGTGLWNEISKELVTTRLKKYSKPAFSIQMLYPHENPKLGLSWLGHRFS